ncbi:DUF1735 domain-containing protein [Antarcticibacterium sp. 1MA-6-2]|uniref:BT_3987 domain-containing protein n=1 Tax=Antarcticibacterium sp. 1MA-6-2 TaxID=2908210 RepID=UPI001F37C195|nr:DUF1735 domain-containing protein [Antarcticibacterium sp. 1MA-6-2]UJH90181.1 DUF1735 domain-containing protein [Antarcticibacterium sp. 1MA-6-2]
MKKILTLRLLLGTLIILTGLSCEETPVYEELTTSTDGVQLYIAKADRVHTLKTFSLEEMEPLEHDTIALNVGYGGLGLPASPIDVNFKINNEVIDSLNLARQINGEKEYVPFPEDAYDFSTTNVSIEKGEAYSNFTHFTYYPEKFEMDKNYLLAVEIESPSGYAINPDRKILLFEVQEVIIPEPEPKYYEKDSWEVIDLSSEEAGGEGPTNGYASAIIDGNIETFWHSCWSSCTAEGSSYPHHITIDMKEELEVSGLGFAQRQSGTRGIELIEIQVSNDNVEWRSLGDFNLQDITALQLIEFEELQSFKYLKIIVKSGYNDGGAAFTALGEVSPYILE